MASVMILLMATWMLLHVKTTWDVVRMDDKREAEARGKRNSIPDLYHPSTLNWSARSSDRQSPERGEP